MTAKRTYNRETELRLIIEVEDFSPETNQISIRINHAEEIEVIDTPTNLPVVLRKKSMCFLAYIALGKGYTCNPKEAKWLRFELMPFSHLSPSKMLDILEGSSPNNEEEYVKIYKIFNTVGGKYVYGQGGNNMWLKLSHAKSVLAYMFGRYGKESAHPENRGNYAIHEFDLVFSKEVK